MEILSISNLDMAWLWTQEEEDQLMGKVYQAQGMQRTMNVALHEKNHKLYTFNSSVEEKWIERYNLA